MLFLKIISSFSLQSPLSFLVFIIPQHTHRSSRPTSTPHTTYNSHNRRYGGATNPVPLPEGVLGALSIGSHDFEFGHLHGNVLWCYHHVAECG